MRQHWACATGITSSSLLSAAGPCDSNGSLSASVCVRAAVNQFPPPDVRRALGARISLSEDQVQVRSAPPAVAPARRLGL